MKWADRRNRPGRDGDVLPPPIDDMWITLGFYTWLIAVVGAIALGVLVVGKWFLAGVVAGWVLSLFAMALYGAWVTK